LADLEPVAGRLQLPRQDRLVVFLQRQFGLVAYDVHEGEYHVAEYCLFDFGKAGALRQHLVFRALLARFDAAAAIDRLAQIETDRARRMPVAAQRIRLAPLPADIAERNDVRAPLADRLVHPFVDAAQFGTRCQQARVVLVREDQRLLERGRADAVRHEQGDGRDRSAESVTKLHASLPDRQMAQVATRDECRARHQNAKDCGRSNPGRTGTAASNSGRSETTPPVFATSTACPTGPDRRTATRRPPSASCPVRTFG